MPDGRSLVDWSSFRSPLPAISFEGAGDPEEAAPPGTLVFKNAPPKATKKFSVAESGGDGEHRQLATALEQSLFTNRSNLKVATSRVAMHLSAAERSNLFASIDRLLDLKNWEEESSRITEASFTTFLRFTIYAHPKALPNLGVAPDGNLLAGWRVDAKSVHVEFMRGDQCLALIKTSSERGPEGTAWRGHVARLREVIRANRAEECID